MSEILKSAILPETSGATNVHAEGEHDYVERARRSCATGRRGNQSHRLLEREERPLDIQPGNVTLLVPDDGA